MGPTDGKQYTQLCGITGATAKSVSLLTDALRSIFSEHSERRVSRQHTGGSLRAVSCGKVREVEGALRMINDPAEPPFLLHFWTRRSTQHRRYTRLLHAAGAGTTIVDDVGLTAWDRARGNGDTEKERLLNGELKIARVATRRATSLSRISCALDSV